MGQDCISFPKFSLRYALVFWPIIQVHSGRAREATWEWFCQGAAARPSGHDRAVQTASLCFVLRAWLSYRDLANCGILTLEVSLRNPPSTRRQELLSLGQERKQRPREERRLAHAHTVNWAELLLESFPCYSSCSATLSPPLLSPVGC